MYRETKLYGLALFTALTLIACGGGDDTSRDGGGDGGATCSPQCSNTQRCSSGTCTSKCDGAGCAQDETCEPTTGLCVAPECQVNGDCNDTTLLCSADKTCVPKCDGVPCSIGDTCEPTTGTCVGDAVTCVVDADCPTGDVCDSSTSICEGGPFQACSPTDACATGHDCIDAGGGGGTICWEACTTATDCGLESHCLDAQFGPLANHCYFNLCRPGGVAAQAEQDVQYGAACDAAGTGDGICVGPLDDGQGTGGQTGLCFGGGTAAPGDACDTEASWGEADACNAGFCVPQAQGQTAGLCSAFCTLFDGTDCADLGTTPQGCGGQWGALGLCFPQDAAPGALGDACTASAALLVCVEDTTCAPVDLQAGATQCLAYCDPSATTSLPGACVSGTCTLLNAQANPFLGLCINP